MTGHEYVHHRHTLEELGKHKGLLGLIFTKSQNKFQAPAKLRRLIVDLIDKGEARSAERVSMSADVKVRRPAVKERLRTVVGR